MQGGTKPEFLKNHVAYYVMFADKWRYADSLEAVTGEQRALHLSSRVNATDVLNSGSLTTEPERDAEVQVSIGVLGIDVEHAPEMGDGLNQFAL